jgi:hypothetical protein
MATAFAATLIHGPAMAGPDLKIATYSIQWPSSYTAGGETMNVSGEFDFVYSVSAPTVEVVADSDGMDSVVLIGGTYDSTDKGYPAATVKLAGYNGGTEVSGDISTIASYIVTVFGK